MSGPVQCVRRPHSAIAALAVVTLAVAACGSGVQESGAPETDIAFGTCDVGFGECGTVTVPLDHSDPDGPKIDLEVARVTAANPEERIGVLLTNPGGPGASGVDFALAEPFPQEVLDRFDIIGWDPRGVGGSAGLTCGENVDDFFDSRMMSDSSKVNN